MEKCAKARWLQPFPIFYGSSPTTLPTIPTQIQPINFNTAAKCKDQSQITASKRTILPTIPRQKKPINFNTAGKCKDQSQITASKNHDKHKFFLPSLGLEGAEGLESSSSSWSSETQSW